MTEKTKKKGGYETRYAKEAEKEAEQVSWSRPPYSKKGLQAKGNSSSSSKEREQKGNSPPEK